MTGEISNTTLFPPLKLPVLSLYAGKVFLICIPETSSWLSKYFHAFDTATKTWILKWYIGCLISVSIVLK